MRRHFVRNVLIVTCMAPLTHSSTAVGQIFSRALHEVPLETENASCMQACSPEELTWGYYHEHWRRWPEEHTLPGQISALSPFATSDRSVPPIKVPDSQDEGLTSPRTRSAPAAPASTTPAPEATPSAIPGGRSAAPATPDREALPDELPSTPSTQPSEPTAPESGSFFPDSEEPVDDLPGVLPADDDSAPVPPGDEPNAAPADEDGFDLDFGRVDPQRLRRYRSSSMSQLRPAGRPTRQAQHSQSRRTEVARRAPEYREPVRAELADRAPAARPSSRSASVRPVAHAEPVESSPPAVPVSDTPPAATVSGRRNPLRASSSASRSVRPAATSAAESAAAAQPGVPGWQAIESADMANDETPTAVEGDTLSDTNPQASTSIEASFVEPLGDGNPLRRG